MVEEGELKIYQVFYVCYFEDFLKFVEYGELMLEIMKNQVMNMVQEYVYEIFEDNSEEFK